MESMRQAALRPEVFCEEMPAPQRIAPWSSALSADVTVDDEDLGTGRLILLHDPAGYDAWDGIPGYPCPRTRVRLYPFGQPPTEPVHALEHTQDPNVLAMSVQESLMWRFQ